MMDIPDPEIILATTVFMAIFFVVAELIQLRPGKSVRYSLRNLFIVTTLIAIALGLAACAARN
jgi:hypothetical protein